jgi:thioredoxin
VIELTKENFDEMVLKSEVPVLVDFWAPWCGPCVKAAPQVEELSTEMTGVKFAKVNVEEQQELGQRFVIRSIPAFILFKAGEPVGTCIGFAGKADLTKFVKALTE